MSVLHLANRQKTRLVDRRLLRRIARCLLEELLRRDSYEIAVHLIGATEMARLNQVYLRHQGSTDVLTFNHQEGAAAESLYGEIFISVDDALVHARRFDVSWQAEIARYLAHGLLHLEGFDDTAPGPRREMKRRENKLLKELSRRFDLGKVGRGQNGVKRE
jgi:probable rRNA maturation factor